MEVDVKIKRYMAPSMRAALDQVRVEQGDDAVILSSRRVKEGIEVIAAVDYDEALMAGAARQYSISLAAAAPPEPPAPLRPEAPAPRPEAQATRQGAAVRAAAQRRGGGECPAEFSRGTKPGDARADSPRESGSTRGPAGAPDRPRARSGRATGAGRR